MNSVLAASIHSDLASLRGAAGIEAIEPAPGLLARRQDELSFTQAMKDTISGVDAEDRAAADHMAAVDAGKSDDLVGAMLASQQASLSFSMLMQVRNKVMGAVDELLKLPV